MSILDKLEKKFKGIKVKGFDGKRVLNIHNVNSQEEFNKIKKQIGNDLSKLDLNFDEALSILYVREKEGKMGQIDNILKEAKWIKTALNGWDGKNINPEKLKSEVQKIIERNTKLKFKPLKRRGEYSKGTLDEVLEKDGEYSMNFLYTHNEKDYVIKISIMLLIEDNKKLIIEDIDLSIGKERSNKVPENLKKFLKKLDNVNYSGEKQFTRLDPIMKKFGIIFEEIKKDFENQKNKSKDVKKSISKSDWNKLSQNEKEKIMKKLLQVPKLSWEKKGGHPKKTIDKWNKKLKDAKFKIIKNEPWSNLDGSRSSIRTTYKDKLGNEAIVYEYLGVERNENNFSVKIKV